MMHDVGLQALDEPADPPEVDRASGDRGERKPGQRSREVEVVRRHAPRADRLTGR